MVAGVNCTKQFRIKLFIIYNVNSFRTLHLVRLDEQFFPALLKIEILLFGVGWA